MYSYGFDLSRSARRRPATSHPSGTPLPQTASIIARWSPDEMPAQVDGSAVSYFADSINGYAAVQTTPANQPKYRTGGQNGKPYIQYSGAQLLDAGIVAAIESALSDGNATVMALFRNPLATTAGALFTASDNTGYNLYANGSGAGLFGTAYHRVPFSEAGLSSITYTGKKPDNTMGRLFINGTCTSAQGLVKPTGTQTIRLGGSLANTLLCYKGEAYDVIIWDRALTPAEVMQAHQWACDKYAMAYPWADGPFHIFHGDSITAGLGMSAPLDSYPAKVAALMGLPMGRWTNLGHTGASYTGPSSFILDTEAVSDVDPIPQFLAGTPCTLSTFEWYNQRNAGSPAPAARAATYLANRKTANPMLKILFGTGTDASDATDNVTARAAYNAYWDNIANRAGLIDAYIPIHEDSLIGVEGACPNNSPYGNYFHTDGIHLSSTGYARLASLWHPILASSL